MAQRCLALWLLLSLSSPVSAQESARSEQVAEARRLHSFGVAASDAQDWEGAARHYRASLALVRRSTVALNLADALLRGGEALEAWNVIQALRSGDFGPLPPEANEHIRPLAIEVRRGIARVVVRSDAERIEWNDEERVLTAGEAVLWTLPGEHELAVIHEGRRVTRTLRLGAGDEQIVEVEAPMPPAASNAAGDAENSSARGKRRRRVLALVFSLVAVGGGVALGVWLAGRGRGPDPVWGQTEALVSW